ncbi:MAG: TetR/AcrR family transcriptional regulator [Ruminococcaceae bacterium]|nr:TetR/AcrR family transcriptional regulator [Oscillospiraceae bacterium]
MSDTMDRRVRRTRERLTGALTELMKEKNINDISVRELAELADINRGTFYLHYRDPFDMLCRLEDELLEQFASLVERYRFKGSLDFDCSNEFFVKIFELVADNAQLISILFCPTGSSTFWSRLGEMLRDGFAKDAEAYFGEQSPVRYGYYCDFALIGIINIVRRWLENGMREPIDEMGTLSRDLILLSAMILQQ